MGCRWFGRRVSSEHCDLSSDRVGSYCSLEPMVKVPGYLTLDLDAASFGKGLSRF